MWADDYWSDDYWSEDYWDKQGSGVIPDPELCPPFRMIVVNPTVEITVVNVPVALEVVCG